MRITIILIALLTAASCRTTKTLSTYNITKEQKLTAPLPDVFLSIYQEPYVLHENDCSNKCAKYARALRRKGYKADIVILATSNRDMYHAVVMITADNGNLGFFCPTSNALSKDYRFFGDIVTIIPYKDMGKSEKYHMGKGEFTINE